MVCWMRTHGPVIGAVGGVVQRGRSVLGTSCVRVRSRWQRRRGAVLSVGLCLLQVLCVWGPVVQDSGMLLTILAHHRQVQKAACTLPFVCKIMVDYSSQAL